MIAADRKATCSLALRLCGAIVLVIGIAMTGGGLWLLVLGGSPYNLIVGLALGVSGGLLCLGHPGGASLYLLTTFAVCAWALWCVGLNGWLLVPRTGLLLLLLAIVGIFWPVGPDGGRVPGAWVARGISVLAIVGLVGLVMTVHVTRMESLSVSVLPAPVKGSDEWTSYGGSLASTRFAPAAQITHANVRGLDVAWVYHTGFILPAEGLFEDEVTPLKVGRTLYLCTPQDVVIAIDAATGAERWRFDPHVDPHATAFSMCRGVSYYRAPETSVSPGNACAERILVGTLDFRLLALDAANGRPCPDFGTQGEVNLGEGFGPYVSNFTMVTSPPTIVRDVAVIGHAVMDNQRNDSPSGVVRAYDVITGKLRWAWDCGREGEAATGAQNERYTLDTPNAWSIFSADEALGLVYVPTGGAPPDYFGGTRRPFDDKYGSSVVALDVVTGQVRWSFQTVHHDLWDYDVGSQPTLIDFATADGPTPALIQPTKTGQIFVLDRRDGRPLTPVEQRPVPRDAVAGDHTAPTQPFSVGIPNFAGAKLTDGDMWGLTPIDQMACTIQFHRSVYEGPFTPPSLTWSIEYPGSAGGIDWGGVAVDTSRGIVIVNALSLANRVRLVPRAEVDALGAKALGDPGADRLWVYPSPQKGTPYGAFATPWLSNLSIPCIRPPWGTLTAVDLKTRKVIWTRPLGTTFGSGPFGIRLPFPGPAGVPNLGGAVVTGGGLTFIGATKDPFIRAFDTQTGEELWRARLPGGGQATPLSYEIDGRQYVVVAAGGHALMQTPRSDAIVAFALPNGKTPLSPR